MEEDLRFTAGLLSMYDAARYLGIPRQTFHRWACGYERGAQLLHVLNPDSPREARVTLIAMAEAWVLFALRHCKPSKVVVDVHRAFGQPIFEGGSPVAGMLKAGEEAGVVAEELGVSIEDVRTAARVLLGHAA